MKSCEADAKGEGEKMSLREREWLGPKLLLVVIASWFFATGIMLMDYGATFKDVGFGQSLVFERIEPRVIYHSGLLMALGSFLIVCVLCAYELSKY